MRLESTVERFQDSIFPKANYAGHPKGHPQVPTLHLLGLRPPALVRTNAKVFEPADSLQLLAKRDG